MRDEHQNEYDRERLIGFGFLVSLLILAGTTASIVAYRIKSIEWSTRSGLDQAYKKLVANPEDPSILKPFVETELTSSQKFAAGYEFNQYVRAYGLYKTLEDIPEKNIPYIESFLAGFKNSDAAGIMDDVLKEKKSDPEKAQKIAKSYKTGESRKVEREIYKFGLDQGIIPDKKTVPDQ